MSALTSNGSRFNLLPMNNFSREMNRWIEELSTSTPVSGMAAVGIRETDTHFHIDIDLPGVVAADVDLKIADGVMHIIAERPIKQDVSWLYNERKFGSVERRFKLPSRVDEEQIDATMDSGVLTVSIAKAPESQVKKIEIRQG